MKHGSVSHHLNLSKTINYYNIMACRMCFKLARSYACGIKQYYCCRQRKSSSARFQRRGRDRRDFCCSARIIFETSHPSGYLFTQSCSSVRKPLIFVWTRMFLVCSHEWRRFGVRNSLSNSDSDIISVDVFYIHRSDECASHPAATLGHD